MCLQTLGRMTDSKFLGLVFGRVIGFGEGFGGGFILVVAYSKDGTQGEVR